MTDPAAREWYKPNSVSPIPPHAPMLRAGGQGTPTTTRMGRMTETPHTTMSKRDLLALIGRTAGASAMLMAMAPLGQAHASTFTGPIKLDGDAKGTSVLVLGAGVAGMVAGLELSRAGYKVQ